MNCVCVFFFYSVRISLLRFPIVLKQIFAYLTYVNNFIWKKNSNKVFSIYDNIICFFRLQEKNWWLSYSSVEWNMVYLFEWHNDPNYLNYYLILSGDCRNLNKMNSEMNQVQIWITFEWTRWGMETQFLLFIDKN